MDNLWGGNYCQYFRIKNNRWPLLSTYCVLDIASHALKAPSQRAAQCNGLCWAISVLTVETVEPEGSETTLVPVRLWAQASAAAGGTPLGWHLTGGRKARMQPRHFYLLFSFLFLFIYFFCFNYNNWTNRQILLSFQLAFIILSFSYFALRSVSKHT